MLLNEIVAIGGLLGKPPINKTKKVQPVSRIVKTENESDVKKKPVPKGRIDTYA